MTSETTNKISGIENLSDYDLQHLQAFLSQLISEDIMKYSDMTVEELRDALLDEMEKRGLMK